MLINCRTLPERRRPKIFCSALILFIVIIVYFIPLSLFVRPLFFTKFVIYQGNQNEIVQQEFSQFTMNIWLKGVSIIKRSNICKIIHTKGSELTVPRNKTWENFADSDWGVFFPFMSGYSETNEFRFSRFWLSTLLYDAEQNVWRKSLIIYTQWYGT